MNKWKKLLSKCARIKTYQLKMSLSNKNTNLPEPGSFLHLIGIGGTGLSNIAYYLLSQGYKIVGSEIQQNLATEWLKQNGVIIFNKHLRSNISRDIKLVIKSAAVKDDNPEIIEANKKNIPIIKYSQALGFLMSNKIGIAISGTHGKTTTASLIAYLLNKAKLNPSFMVGGVLKDFNTGSIFGSGDHFVAEACEYDRSFHHLPALVKIITNIEPDHMDYYKTFNNLIESFHQFIATTSDKGFVIANIENLGVQKCLKKKIVASLITFASKPFKKCQWYPQNIRVISDKWHFEAWKNGRKYGDFVNSIPGKHNVLNALAVIIVADIINIDKNSTHKALTEFMGVRRRFEIIGRVAGRIIIDDYGHHPTEIRSVLDTAREVFPDRRLWFIFQPHLYSRTKLFLKEFARVLSKADTVLLPPIYAARDTKPAQQIVSSSDLVYRINQYGGSAKYLSDFPSIVEYLLENTIPKDVVITIGAGDVWQIGPEFIRQLKS
jgi:UDP-N-acetylmuramate--alanine ligase